MQNATRAYNQTATATSTPRELEATLLMKAAKKLQDIRDDALNDKAALEEALIYNRKLWSVFVGSVTGRDNELPQTIKNNIASLGVFIFKQTHETKTAPAPEKLDSLIAINREIAAGLRGKA